MTSEQKPAISAMSSFKRRASEERAAIKPEANTSEANMTDNVIPSISVEVASPVATGSPKAEIEFPRKTLDFDVVDDDDEAEYQPEVTADPEMAFINKKLPPPPIPPRISSLLTSSSAAPSPLSQKIASSK